MRELEGMTVQNAFQSVRPRGPNLNIPAKPPKGTSSSAATKSGLVHQALDRNGRRTVSMDPCTLGNKKAVTK